MGKSASNKGKFIPCLPEKLQRWLVLKQKYHVQPARFALADVEAGDHLAEQLRSGRGFLRGSSAKQLLGPGGTAEGLAAETAGPRKRQGAKGSQGRPLS